MNDDDKTSSLSSQGDRHRTDSAFSWVQEHHTIFDQKPSKHPVSSSFLEGFSEKVCDINHILYLISTIVTIGHYEWILPNFLQVAVGHRDVKKTSQPREKLLPRSSSWISWNFWFETKTIRLMIQELNFFFPREVTHFYLLALLKMIFLFPRWNMLVLIYT